MSSPKSLTETSNFRPDVLGNLGRISSFYLMSEEFMSLSKIALRHSSRFSQRGMIRYHAGIFCLGHALELTYKVLLLKDGSDPPKYHDFDKLFRQMKTNTRENMSTIIQHEGWNSCNEFHQFMATRIDFTKRKYYESGNPLDYWTHDRSGSNINHMLWPPVVQLCEYLLRYAASTVWLNPAVPADN